MYYVSRNGVQQGPHSLSTINTLLTKGELSGSDLAWAENMPDWVPVSTLPGVYDPAMRSPGGPPPLPSGGSGPPPVPGPAGAYAPPLSAVSPQQWVHGMPPVSSGLATASLVLGILALVLFFTILGGLVLGLVAIIFGHVARGNISRSRGRVSGGGLALVGLITGYLGFLISGALMISIYIFAYRFGDSFNTIAQHGKAAAEITILTGHVQRYAEKHNGEVPSNAAGLRVLVTEGILTDETLLYDPWGEPVQYQTPARRSGHKFDIWSKGEDRATGTADDIGNWSHWGGVSAGAGEN